MDNVKDDPDKFVRVTDMAGKEFICPLNALRDPASCTEEELLHCFSSAEEAFSEARGSGYHRRGCEKAPVGPHPGVAVVCRKTASVTNPEADRALLQRLSLTSHHLPD